MSKNLVIVESPAKAKTIEGYLGKDYKVVSSYGHVRDLPKDEMAIDIEHGFKPTYEIPKEKKEVVRELKKLSKEHERIFLASDDDREGEAISWHLKESLKLQDERTKRIVFSEITKTAILNAIGTPRDIDIDLVNAQQARRVLDRLVGFELSPLLWKKIKRGLSAGRVQSVAVRLVVEREREIENFEAKSNFKITALFNLEDGKELKAELPGRFDTEKEAREFLELCRNAVYTISGLEKKPGRKSPAPPFTTSTLQQEASRKLGYSVSRTMSIAQKLYESGKISYMRTDSVTLSRDALLAAKNEIISSFGESYVKTRQYKNKSKGAQEAHEAIRPTNFAAMDIGMGGGEQRLYDLIRKRAIASQMADAKTEKTVATISISGANKNLIAQGEVILFDGFLKVYTPSGDEEDHNGNYKNMLPPLQVGQILELNEMQAREIFAKPPPRYTEASLVKKLEELGIGRPSTYAPTISTIQKREYVTRESRDGMERVYREMILKDSQIKSTTGKEFTGKEKNKLFPTNMAMIVNDFLVQQFATILDYSFTANVEEELDAIAEGRIDWHEMISDFYKKFHPSVESSKSISRSDIGSVRELGFDPATGKKVYAKIGKFGPYIQIGENGPEEKPLYSSLRNGQLLETITLEEALELFKLPRTLGTYEDQEVQINIGKFGPYVRHGNKFCSLGDQDDPMTITMDRAVELIMAKRAEDASRIIKTFDENPEYQILKGKWGPYLKAGRKNVKLPKDKKAEDLTYDECVELVKNAPSRKKSARRRKK